MLDLGWFSPTLTLPGRAHANRTEIVVLRHESVDGPDADFRWSHRSANRAVEVRYRRARWGEEGAG